MGESETPLCQHTQRERPCQGCQGLERERVEEKNVKDVGRNGGVAGLSVNRTEGNEETNLM